MPRILIVDDVPANSRLLETRLKADYYLVASARDGFEALAEFDADGSPDRPKVHETIARFTTRWPR